MTCTLSVNRRLGYVLALGAFGVVGCGPSTSRSDRHAAAAGGASWSEARGGLRIALQIPPGEFSRGESMPLELMFRNDSDEPIRVYLIENEVFRSFQSRFVVRSLKKDQLISVQPEPLPHGYVVSEGDFPLIEPRATRTFSQTLYLHDREFDSGERYLVEWTYQNDVEAWAGGVETLDGPTQKLFGGERIPHIWTGELSTTSAFEVAPSEREGS